MAGLYTGKHFGKNDHLRGRRGETGSRNMMATLALVMCPGFLFAPSDGF